MSIQAKICREFEWTRKDTENQGFDLSVEVIGEGDSFVLRNRSYPDLRDDCRIAVFETLAEVRSYLAGMTQQRFMDQFIKDNGYGQETVN